MQRLVALIRAKNEEELLPHCLESIRSTCTHVFLLDDGSTDKTPEIAKAFPNLTYLRQDLRSFDETRDRKKLYQAFEESGLEADWLLIIDADEELEAIAGEVFQRELPKIPDYFTIVRVKWVYMRRDRNHCQDCGLNKRLLFRRKASKRLRIVSDAKAHLYFPSDAQHIIFDLGVILKHTGYMRETDVNKKFDLYRHVPVFAGTWFKESESREEWAKHNSLSAAVKEYRDRPLAAYQPLTFFDVLGQLVLRKLARAKGKVKKWL